MVIWLWSGSEQKKKKEKKKRCDLLIQVCVVSVLLTFHCYLAFAPMHALHIGLTCGM